MIKVHYAHELKSYQIPILLCGLIVYHKVSTDAEKVTCKKCLKILNKEKK